MSYARWSNSEWYVFWHASSGLRPTGPAGREVWVRCDCQRVVREEP